MNNLTFIRAERIDSHMKVKDSARPALDALLEILSDLSRIGTEEEARGALRAFIEVRRGYRKQYSEADHGPLGLTPLEFAERIAAFIAETSEGGKRAQAVTAGLLAMLFEAERVVSKGVHDPDRRLPGDVGVRSEGAPESLETADKPVTESLHIVLEVRDKPVTASDLRAFVEKAIGAGVRRAGMVAIAGRPEAGKVLEQVAYAAERGVMLVMIPSWPALLDSLLFWSGQDVGSALNVAHRAVSEQLRQIEASVEAVQQWDEIGEA